MKINEREDIGLIKRALTSEHKLKMKVGIDYLERILREKSEVVMGSKTVRRGLIESLQGMLMRS